MPGKQPSETRVRTKQVQHAKADRRTFTEKNVLTLKPRKKDRTKQHMIWDWGTEAARGLGILVSPSGARSYRVYYYFPGSPKAHSKHLGRVGEMTLAEARKLTREARGQAIRGEDPKANSPLHSDSFETVVGEYIRLEQINRRQNKSAEATKRVMLGNCAPWLTRPIATLRYQEVEALLWRIRDGDPDKDLKPRPHLSNRVYAHLKDCFEWCARRKLLGSSPMVGMEAPWSGAKPRDRDWFKKVAADDAIKVIWRAAETIGGDEGRYLKLMLLTGKRRTALSLMRWEQIGDDWFWDAPPSEVKNKRLHGVPLPALAQRNLRPRKKEGPVFGSIDFTSLMRAVRRLTGIDDFFFHGVRHLVETKTAELRDAQDHPIILPHVRDLLFDHAPNRGAGKGYDHHDYKPEMRSALEAWAAYVEGLVSVEGAALLR